FFQGTVDVMPSVNFDRREQTGQGGASLDGARNGYVVPAGSTKGRGFAGVEFGGDQREPRLQLPKVVAAARAVEEMFNLAVDIFVVEHTSGQGGAQLLQRLRQRFALCAPGP